MKHVEILVAIAFILGCGFGYIVADDKRIELDSGVRMASK